MSDSDPVVGAQLKHLLTVVEQRRRERCREVLDKAHEQARQLIKQAYRDERHFEVKSTIAAGLRIFAGEACMDGSVDGLLRERLTIEAGLLARINEHRGRQD